VQRVADRVLELVYRVLGEAGQTERGITNDTLASVLESSAEQGLLLDGEAEFLAGVVELSEVRVREVMTPRVDMLLLDVAEESTERAAVTARAVAMRAAWVVVVDGTPDRVLGRVRVRDLLMRPEAPVRELLQPVRFVPEVASLVHLMEFLRREKVAQAVVVDEWGGTAGLVRMEDVIEEIVGDLRVEGETSERAVARLDEGRFRVLGNLSIRDWNEHFGLRVVPTEFETVGGFVTALLARIPRSGDVVRSGPLEFRVDEVRRRRIHSLVISLGVEAGGAP
jgi:putative hemolysin